VGTVVGLIVAGAAMSVAAWQVAALMGWDATALVVVGWALPVIVRCDSPATAALAMREDDSRVAADAVIVAAGLASLVGVGLVLLEGARSHGAAQAWITALAVASVVLSWSAVQTVYTLHYAHLYYSGGGGIDFNGDRDERPDFRDFAYLAVTIGMTYQVSDTDLTTKTMRRTATHQALLSYVFGTFVVAMTINVVAGLVR
jgi:uncharacterized membrane protein